MKRILLILSTTRKSPKSINTALDLAQKNQAELVILFVLDDGLAQNIMDKMSEEAWVGGKTSEEVQHSILREYFSQGKAKIKEIEEEAERRGVKHRSIFSRGSFVIVALGVIAVEKIDLVIVTRRKRSDLSRFLFGSPVAELQKNAECDFMIIDE